MAKPANRKLKSIKSGTFSRGLSLAKMTFSAGAQAAGHAVGNLFADSASQEKRGTALLLSQATVIAKELGALKGSVMKVGQMLSMFGEHLLPPEVNSILKSLQNQSPALEWIAIEKVIKRRLNAEQRMLLTIEPEALACASLGQVHLATRKSDSLKIALKIQYPGVETAIESDLKSMRSILSMAKLIPGGAQYDELFKEVREMLHREVDYQKELQATLDFQKLLESDPRYIVPTPIPEFSSKKILATTFEEGVSVDSPQVAALSLERRNALAIAAYELYLREIFEFRKVQTDPHFGNYQIRIAQSPESDGRYLDQIVLFDFGAMREVSLSFLKNYREMVKGALEHDYDLLKKAAIQMELIRETDSEKAHAQFVELCLLMMEPSNRPADEAYPWGKSDLAKRMMVQGSKFAFEFKLRPPPREMLFINRKTGGVFFFLSMLNAEFNPAPLLRKYL